MSGSKRSGLVSLRYVDDARGLRSLEASLREDGGISIVGQDLGVGVERAFGEGLTEYEWAWVVQPNDVPAAVEALGGRKGDDPLRVLAAWSSAHGGDDPGSHLKEVGVPISFWNRVGD